MVSTLIILILAGFASAAVQIVDTEVTFNADYSDLNDRDCTASTTNCKDYVTETITFKVSNTAETDVIITVSEDISDSKYVLENKEETILGNATEQTVTRTIKVPHDQDFGKTTLGNIKITDKANSANTNSKPVVQNTLSMLEFTKFEIDYTSEDGSESDNFDGDDETDTEWDLVERAIPGEEIVLIFKYENLFDKNYRYGDFDEIILTIDDQDGLSDDIDDEWDLGNLDAGAKDSFEISFTPEDDADGSYDLEITLEATDEKNVKYEIVRTLTIDIKRERDDVRIITAEPLSTPIYTCDANFQFKVKIRNFGSDDQKYAGVSIYNSVLKINENIADLKLNEFDNRNDVWEKTFTFPLNKVKADRYHVDVRSYIDRDEEMDFELVQVDIIECPPTIVVENTTEDTEVIVNVLDTTGSNNPEVDNKATPVGSSEVIETIENPYTSEDFFVATIIIAFVLIVAMIVIFVVVLLK